MSEQQAQPSRILIVEDEGIVAADIQKSLEDCGYEVTGIAASADDALLEASRACPDLVLMDIRIQGSLDGIETAARLREQFGTPVIYLTAHGDPETFERAKSTNPLGFVLKPFKLNELRNAIEIGLNRGRAERQLHERERSFASAMDAVGDAVITMDGQSRIRFLNRAAETLTGWSCERADGRHIDDVLKIARDRSLEHTVRIEDLLAGSAANDPYSVRSLAGDYRWVTVRGVHISESGPGPISILVLQDVTRRRHAEEAMRRQADLLDQSWEPIYTLDANGIIDYWNCGAERLYGFSRDQAKGRVAVDLLQTKALNADDFRSALRRDGRWRGELKQSTREGAALVVESLMVVSKEPLGRESTLVTNRDITDRKKLNDELETRVRERTAELRDSEERFRMLIENIQDYAILMLDPEGTVVSWTPAAERIKGYAAAEIVGRSFECFYEAADVERGHPRQMLRCAREEGRFEEEGWRVRKDGSRFWANVIVTALYDESGALRGYSKVTRDVTKRRQIEQKLVESEEQFRVLLDCAPDGIVIADHEGRLALVNEQAEKLFGYSRHELIGQPLEVLVPAEARERHTRHNADYRSAPFVRPMGAGMELKGLRKDGGQFPIEVSLSPIRTAKGDWVAAGVRDITERKASEQRLIAERRRAEEANRTKSDFLAAMSHEIRTPMNAILGMAELLGETELNHEQRRYVEVFRRAGSSLLTLIDDILDFSRIEMGQFELEHVAFEMEEVVDQVLELIGPKARSKSIDLMSRLSPGLATSLAGDPHRLRQILINLLGNAVKFTESGHILLTIENAASGQPGEIAFGVSDTGIGIPPEKLGSIFGEFTQADNSITRKYGGSGLGLAISRRLVHRMGGELKVESTVGKGSTFSFTARFAVVAKQPEGSRGEWKDLRGRRVLVVDNNAVNCLILRETLEAWGIEARAFERPKDALAEIERAGGAGENYSLAIIDKHIPGMDGFELGAKAREMAPGIPILMLSSDSAPGDVSRSVKDGFSGYAVKPVKRSDLLRYVCGAMNVSTPAEASKPSPAVREFEGPALKILAVEDSVDNRVLLEAYLNGSPHSIAFAEDGVAAIDAFNTTTFDLIFMDLQMPRMDGLTATRKIRALEAERRLPRIPIVALSANARPEDYELSRGSGCDAHLAKPVSKVKFLSAIEAFGPGKAPLDADKPGVPDDGSRVDVKPPKGLEALTARYIASRKAEAPRLLELAKAREFAQIRVLGHDMKGTGGAYGIPMLTTFGAAIESAAKASDIEALDTQLGELVRFLDRVSTRP